VTHANPLFLRERPKEEAGIMGIGTGNVDFRNEDKMQGVMMKLILTFLK
jgi:hypothetical protein